MLPLPDQVVVLQTSGTTWLAMAPDFFKMMLGGRPTARPSSSTSPKPKKRSKGSGSAKPLAVLPTATPRRCCVGPILDSKIRTVVESLTAEERNRFNSQAATTHVFATGCSGSDYIRNVYRSVWDKAPAPGSLRQVYGCEKEPWKQKHISLQQGEAVSGPPMLMFPSMELLAQGVYTCTPDVTGKMQAVPRTKNAHHWNELQRPLDLEQHAAIADRIRAGDGDFGRFHPRNAGFVRGCRSR